METSLDDLLNGTEPTEAPAEVAQEAPAEAAPPETIGQPRDESGRFAPKETGVENEQPVPPTEQPNQLPPHEYAALKDERRKRQEAEARIAALEMQFQAAQQANRPPEQPVDFWEDPQAVIARQFEQFGQQFREQLKHEQMTERLDASEAAARMQFPDFDEKLGAFQQAAQLNPALAREMAMAPDPAKFAYERGRTALEIQRAGSLDEVLKAERAKWEAEVRAQMPAPPTLPATTATDGSVGGRSGPAWTGPVPMDQLLR